MRAKTLALLIVLYGCAPMPPVSTSSPRPSTSAQPSGTPVAMASPTATPLPLPQLPEAMTKGLEPVAGLSPEMRERETWWANSGISDNRLAYYASTKTVSELEAELSGPLMEGYREYLEGVGAWVSFEGLRLALVKSEKEGPDRMLILAPLPADGSTPEALKQLKLPVLEKPDWKGQKTLVVMSTGEGLGQQMDHMLGQAGLVITPSPSATPSATPN